MDDEAVNIMKKI